ncbi:MAG: pseudouridine-5'-phosphate glycosidase [Pseudomonadota bacterium]
MEDSETRFDGLVLHPTVKKALSSAEPVVALESTIITHGMPYPQNLEMAEEVEDVIRQQGATPATIAVLDGSIRVGLSSSERSRLAQTMDARKASRADLAYAIAQGESAGTTVAATMMVAQLAGIKVFATGGIGGVHSGAQETFDISADLTELARTDVIVVCAGAKAILDIPKTLEVLETNGVPVVGYQTDQLPAFWSRESGIRAPLRLDSAEQIAQFQRARQALRIAGGMLITNPIPRGDDIPASLIKTYIDQAQTELEDKGITGKAVTPFLLGRIVELSGGKSLESNIALVRNNARLAAEIAVAMAG